MKHQWGGSHLTSVNSQSSRRGKMYPWTSPKSSAGSGLVQITQRLYFCTTICLDIRESSLWLSSNLPWPSGLTAHTALWDPSWESWLKKETPISELVLDAWCMLWGRWPQKRTEPRRRCSEKPPSEGRQKDLLISQAGKQLCDLLGHILRFTKDSDLLLPLSEPLIYLFIFSAEDLMFELRTKCPISI